jgi:putative photosynthetic complex assembly protein
MSNATHSFPRLPLIGAAALLTVAIGTVAAARLSGVSARMMIHDDAPVASRMLRFEDRGDGSVGVIDAKTAVDIAVAAPGTNGFLRGTMRGLMRTRKLNEVNVREPFRLELFADGQLVLTDTVVQKPIALNAFGPSNAAVFAAFLPTQKGESK